MARAAGQQAASAARRSRTARGLRIALLALIGLLYAVSIPWYRSANPEPGLWWGLPDWVAVALGCYVAIAVLSALAWLLTDVPETEEAGFDEREP